MAAGDVAVTEVSHPTATTIDTALTALRVTGGANGTYGVVAYENKVFCYGITEA